jgi:hypothetical protein
VVINADFFQVFRQYLLRKSWLFLIHVDGCQLKFNRRIALEGDQNIQQSVGILSTRQANHYIVTLVYHVEIFDSSADLSP